MKWGLKYNVGPHRHDSIKFITKSWHFKQACTYFFIWIMLVKFDWSRPLSFTDSIRQESSDHMKRKKEAWFMSLRHVNQRMHICTNKYTHIQPPKPQVKLNPRGIKSIGMSGKTVILFSLLHTSEWWLQSASALQPPKAALDYSHSVPRQKT